jgi:BlaI family transcriptional regulator, penicillinase repressor
MPKNWHLFWWRLKKAKFLTLAIKLMYTAAMSENELSRRERQIMQAIYSVGEATAAQVVDLIADPPSRTAIRTMLTILVEKKQLKYYKRGREFVYQPCRPIEKAGKSAFKDLLQTFFGGSLENALASHLAEKNTPLDEDQLRRIEKMIRDKRKEQG